jgi:hypothetical protein
MLLKDIINGYIEPINIEILQFLNIKELCELMLVNKFMNQHAHKVPVEYYLDNLELKAYNQFAKTFPNAKSLNIVKDESIDFQDPNLFNRMRNLRSLQILQSGLCFTSLCRLERLVVRKLTNIEQYLPLLPTRNSLSFLKIDYCREEERNENFTYVDISQFVPNLQTLHIRYRNIPFNYLDNFTNIVELCLVWCQNITSESFKYLTKLERLYARDNGITDDAFIYLLNLKLLHFEGEDITDSAFKYLPKLETLNLKLKNCIRHDNEQLIKEDGFKYLINLKNLTIHNSCSRPLDITSKIFTVLPKLKSLNLHCCDSMINKDTFDLLPELDYMEIDFGYYDEPIICEKNIFSKLKVKHLALDRAFRHITRKDLKDLMKNGMQTLNIIKESYADSRFSPVFQEKIVLTGKDILRFFKIKKINKIKNLESRNMKLKKIQKCNKRLTKKPYFNLFSV